MPRFDTRSIKTYKADKLLRSLRAYSNSITANTSPPIKHVRKSTVFSSDFWYAPTSKEDVPSSSTYTSSTPSESSLGTWSTDSLSLKLTNDTDGGYAWFVVMAAFLVQVVTNGIIFSFAIVYVELLEEFQLGKGITSMVGSINVAVFSLSGGTVREAVRQFGPKRVSLFGSFMVLFGLVASSYAEQLWHLMITYSAVLGIAFTCQYYASLDILRDWFHEKRALATSLALSGVGIGAVAFAPLTEYLIRLVGWKKMFLIEAVIAFVVYTSMGFILTPPPTFSRIPSVQPKLKTGRCDLFKNMVFICLTISALLITFAYYVPVIHLVQYGLENGVSRTWGVILLMFFGGGSAIGRLLLGQLVDRFSARSLFSMAAILTGLVTMLTPLYDSRELWIFYATAYGFFSGSFLAFIPLMIAELMVGHKLPKVFGVMGPLEAVTVLIGAPVVGWLSDLHGSYDYAFVVTGIIIVASVFPLFLAPCFKSKKNVFKLLTFPAFDSEIRTDFHEVFVQ